MVVQLDEHPMREMLPALLLGAVEVVSSGDRLLLEDFAAAVGGAVDHE